MSLREPAIAEEWGPAVQADLPDSRTRGGYENARSRVAEPTNGDGLVRAHIHLVKSIARRIKRRLPSNVELDDLVQTGMIGLLEAASRYDGRSDASFETYATLRIRGSIIDSLRHSDWCSRSLRKHIRDIDNAKARIACETGRAPKAAAVAQALGISLGRYHGLLRDYAAALHVPLDEADPVEGAIARAEPVDGALRPPDEVERDEFLGALASAIDLLPERERAILQLYYDKDYMMREIGAVLALSESRICQIHRGAMKMLRTALN